MPGKGKRAEAKEGTPQNKNIVYVVKVSRRWARKLETLPLEVQDRFELLIEDMKEKGPFRTEWPNYSPLENDY